MTGRKSFHNIISTYLLIVVTYANKMVVINILDNYRQTVTESSLILVISSGSGEGGGSCCKPKENK